MTGMMNRLQSPLEPKLENDESRRTKNRTDLNEKLLKRVKKRPSEAIKGFKEENNESEGHEGHQCTWCRRVLSNSTGLIRHRNYCTWNPALRSEVQNDVKKIKGNLNTLKW